LLLIPELHHPIEITIRTERQAILQATGQPSEEQVKQSIEEAFRAVVHSHTIPGVVLLSSSRDGKFQYSNTFGNLSIADANSAPISADSPMWIASCTKLLTTIVALQCVERGLLALDAAVSPIPPQTPRPGHPNWPRRPLPADVHRGSE
jgi:CubicO group peptidase (beta-lactamase class C family)